MIFNVSDRDPAHAPRSRCRRAGFWCRWSSCRFDHKNRPMVIRMMAKIGLTDHAPEHESFESSSAGGDADPREQRACTQNGRPPSVLPGRRGKLRRRRGPWAKLITPVARKMTTKPSATRAYTPPSASPSARREELRHAASIRFRLGLELGCGHPAAPFCVALIVAGPWSSAGRISNPWRLLLLVDPARFTSVNCALDQPGHLGLLDEVPVRP